MIIPLFHEISREIEGGSYELYAEVLRRTAVEIAKRDRLAARALALGLPARLRRSAGRRSRRPTPQLKKFRKKYQTGLISNIDDKLLGQTRRHIPGDFDLVVTAQQVRSYKPDPAHFKEFERRIGGKKGWVHIACEPLPRRRAVREAEGAGDLGQPHKEELEPGQKKPTGRGQDPARGREAARPLRRPRARRRPAPRRPRRDSAAIWQTDLHRRPRAATSRFVIDSPVLPEELEALPALLEQAGCGVLRAAGHARRLGPPPRAPAPSRTRRSASPRRPRARLTRRARRRRSASCAPSTSEHYVERRGRCRSARSRRCRCRAGSTSATQRARAASRRRATPPTAWRSGSPWAARAGLRRLPLAGRDPDGPRRTRAALPSRRSSACARSSSGRVRRPRPRRRAGRRPRAGDPPRGRRLPGGLHGLPLARRDAEQRRIDAANRERLGA